MRWRHQCTGVRLIANKWKPCTWQCTVEKWCISYLYWLLFFFLMMSAFQKWLYKGTFWFGSSFCMEFQPIFFQKINMLHGFKWPPFGCLPWTTLCCAHWNLSRLEKTGSSEKPTQTLGFTQWGPKQTQKPRPFWKLKKNLHHFSHPSNAAPLCGAFLHPRSAEPSRASTPPKEMDIGNLTTWWLFYIFFTDRLLLLMLMLLMMFFFLLFFIFFSLLFSSRCCFLAFEFLVYISVSKNSRCMILFYRNLLGKLTITE